MLQLSLFLYILAGFIVLVWLWDELYYIHLVYGVRNWFLSEVHRLISFLHKIFGL